MENLFDALAGVTPAAETTTGEPVAEQAPTTTDDGSDTATQEKLPAGYLNSGYYATTEKGAKYLRPEFVGQYAEIMAALLAGMKPSDFNGLLRELKRNKKSTLPFEARQTAALELIPKALSLVNRKKAPALLVTFLKDNIDHIREDADWAAFFRFLEAIAAYMTV